MCEKSPNIDLWILKEFEQLGIPPPKLKKIRLQIQKKNQKGKTSGVFGVCLSKLLAHDELQNHSTTRVPIFLEKMADFLSGHVTHNCIFRKSGKKDRMKQLQARLEIGHELLTNESVEDAAGVLKSWFRNLPVSLIPEEFHELFICCHRVCEKSCSSKALLMACSLLPPENLATLKFILEFLAAVAKHSAVNKMSPQSLAIVFAPNFMPILSNQRLDKSVSIEVMKEKQDKAQNVVQWFIEHWEEVKNTPQSVQFLAQLATLPDNKSNRKKTKRRKSVCDIVGVKIKKMVAPHSDDKVKSMKETAVIKHKMECQSVHSEIPLKRSKKLPDHCVKENVSGKPNSDSGTRETTEVLAGIVTFNSHRSAKVKKGLTQKKPSSSSISSKFPQLSQEVDDLKVIEDQLALPESNSAKTENHVCDDNPTVRTSSDLPVYCSFEMTTPAKVGNGEDRPRSTLKRGRPNTVKSGLRSRRKANLRGSSSLENLVLPFESLKVSRRKSRSASSVFDRSNEDGLEGGYESIDVSRLPSSGSQNDLVSCNTSGNLDNCKSHPANDMDSSVSVNRVLDFLSLDKGNNSSSSSTSSEKCQNRNSFSPVLKSAGDLFGTSLGFSPILNSDVEEVDGNEKTRNKTWCTLPPNVSRNPFDDITNDSDIPTLNSSIGDNSLFASHLIPNEDSNTKKKSLNLTTDYHFATPSPIVNHSFNKKKNKSSIVACSTPASDLSKISWQGATSFDFEKSIENQVEGPKRESIIKLKETNAGKVLANINLYNQVGHNVLRISQSPAPLKNNAFERNALGTKSVRERSKPFLELQGFKVPSICPNSIRRNAQRNKLVGSLSVPVPNLVTSPSKDHVTNIVIESSNSNEDSSSIPLFDRKSTSDSKSAEGCSDSTKAKRIFIHSNMLI